MGTDDLIDEMSDLDDQNQTAGIDTKEGAEKYDDLSPPTLAGRAQSWSPGAGNCSHHQELLTKFNENFFNKNPISPGEEVDNVANYVNMAKLFHTSDKDYAYSKENASSRKLIDKMAKKKNVTRHLSHLGFMDESCHSKESMLSQRSSASAYRGPEPKLKSGRKVNGILKRRDSSAGSVLSLDDLSGDALGAETNNNTATVNSPITKGKRNISFQTVDIREHERIAGDNPCVSKGVPLSIGWKYVQHDPLPLDDYENFKGPARDKVEMMVPSAVRRSMLRDEFGVTVKEMNESMKQVNITKSHRRHTVASEHMEGWTEVLQSAKRKFGRMVKGTSTDKEQHKLWEKAHKIAMGEYLKAKGNGSLGANPESVGAGQQGVGPTIVVDGKSPPCLEIAFDKQGGEDAAPQF